MGSKFPAIVNLPYDVAPLFLPRMNNILDVECRGKTYNLSKMNSWLVTLLSRYGDTSHITQYTRIDFSIPNLERSTKIPLARLLQLTKKSLNYKEVKFEMGSGKTNADIGKIFSVLKGDITQIPDNIIWEAFWYLAIYYLIMEPIATTDYLERIPIGFFMFTDIFHDFGLYFGILPVIAILNERISIAKSRPKMEIETFVEKISRNKSVNKETKCMATHLRKGEILDALEIGFKNKLTQERLRNYVLSEDTIFRINSVDVFATGEEPYNSEIFYIASIFNFVLSHSQTDSKLRKQGGKFTSDLIRGFLPFYSAYSRYIHGSKITLSGIDFLLTQNKLAFNDLTNIFIQNENYIYHLIESALA